MAKALNLVGQIFGKLTVTSRAENHVSRSGKKLSAFNCICECGREVVLTGDSLKRTRATTCGHGCLLKAERTAQRAEQRKLATNNKMKSARAAVLALKRKVHQAQIDEDMLFGLCKRLPMCDKYYLYQDGRLFSMRSCKYLKLDWHHGDYTKTSEGITLIRRTPCYTVVLDHDVDTDEDAGQERFTIAGMLLTLFDRPPVNGERAWSIDYLRSQKKNPTLDMVEWVSQDEHIRRSKQLAKLAVMKPQQKRYHIRKWDSENLQKMWENTEHFYL